MSNKVSVKEKYGSLKPGSLYTLMQEGYDYYILRHRGKNLHVPKKIVDLYPVSPSKKANFDENEYEDCLDEYYMDGV